MPNAGPFSRTVVSDVSHTAWNEAAEYRFLDEALRQPDGDRTPLQRRVLVAVELLSQAWLS
jgi:hypothetical protein